MEEKARIEKNVLSTPIMREENRKNSIIKKIQELQNTEDASLIELDSKQFEKYKHDVKTTYQRVQSEISHIKNELENIGNQEDRKKILETLLIEYNGLSHEMGVLSRGVRFEAHRRTLENRNKLEKLIYSKPEMLELSRLPEVQKNINQLENSFNVFNKKYQDISKSEAYKNKTVDLNLERIGRMKTDISDLSAELVRCRSDIISMAATFAGENEQEFSKKIMLPLVAGDVVALVDNSMKNLNQFSHDERLWKAINTMNGLARKINVLNNKVITKENEITKTQEAFNKKMLTLKEAIKNKEADIRKEEMAKIADDRDKFFIRHTGNPSALSGNRLRHSSITEEEAEKLLRKRDFLDELRIQQALCEDTDVVYEDLRDDILTLGKQGALKAKQFSGAVVGGLTEIVSELGGQGLHAIDTTIVWPLALPIKLINGIVDWVSRPFAALGAYMYESPRDKISDTWKKDTDNWGTKKTWDKVKVAAKWGFGGIILGAPALVSLAVGGVCRTFSKLCSGFCQWCNYDNMSEKYRGFTTGGGAITGLIYTGLALTGIGAIAIGIGAIAQAFGLAGSTAHSVKRAAKKASNAVQEMTDLKLNTDDAIKLALWEYDNPNKAKDIIAKPSTAKAGLQSVSQHEAPQQNQEAAPSVQALATGPQSKQLAQQLESAQSSIVAAVEKKAALDTPVALDSGNDKPTAVPVLHLAEQDKNKDTQVSKDHVIPDVTVKSSQGPSGKASPVKK